MNPLKNSCSEVALQCCTHEAEVVWQHHNNLSIMIPDHPPEVCGCVGQRMLGNDELVAPVIAL